MILFVVCEVTYDVIFAFYANIHCVFSCIDYGECFNDL